MNRPTERYTHGHHSSVLKSHTWRTIANSAAYLEANLDSGLALLDVGCGPGTITVEFPYICRRCAVEGAGHAGGT